MHATCPAHLILNESHKYICKYIVLHESIRLAWNTCIKSGIAKEVSSVLITWYSISVSGWHRV
jgi:hypothetical protein